MNSDKNSHSNTGTPSRHPEAITRHPEAQAVPCGHPDSYGSPSACQRLKQESIANKEIPQAHSCLQNDDLTCHPEEQRELRILPEKNASQERWSDSEHTRLSQSRKDDSFRMTNNTPTPAVECRGEVCQNQKHVNDNY